MRLPVLVVCAFVKGWKMFGGEESMTENQGKSLGNSELWRQLNNRFSLGIGDAGYFLS